MISLLLSKCYLAIVHDLTMVVVCWLLAYWLRFNLDLPELYLPSASRALMQVAGETGLEVVIIRLPLVYGPGLKANFNEMMRWLRKGVPLPLGSLYNQRSMVASTTLSTSLPLACAPSGGGQPDFPRKRR